MTQELERDGALEAGVVRLGNDPHAPAANLFAKYVGTRLSARLQSFLRGGRRVLEGVRGVLLQYSCGTLHEQSASARPPRASSHCHRTHRRATQHARPASASTLLEPLRNAVPRS